VIQATGSPLPTFGAMKLAGPDKPLRYVMGSKPPAAASWQLPAMEVGDCGSRR
jgi:hypothetical protein